MHTRRVLTGLIAVALMLTGVLTPARYQVTLILVIAITLPAIAETWSILGNSRPRRQLACVMVVAALVQVSMALKMLELTLCVVVAGVMILSLFTMAWGIEGSRARLASSILCLLMVSLPLGCVCVIRNGDHGAKLLVFLLSVACFSDTGALYAGTLFGKHPMSPRISPNKTWEGALGGAALALAVVLGWALVWRAMGHDTVLWLSSGWTSWIELTALTLMITALSQLGDLAESTLKRDANVKDSGSHMLGHGGFLDMVDAVLWSAPGTFVYAVFRGFI